jgi:hypothetical protein
MKHREYELAPVVPDPVPESIKSKKFAPADLPVGTPVFYQGERYWIESVPPTWDHSAHVRIGSMRFNPEAPDKRLPDERHTFCVSPDMLELAPTGKTLYSKAPTQAAVKAKIEREAKGVKDAGDIVADTLRGLDLDAVYAAAAKFMKEDEQALRDKYGHLNPGQQRMNCGNRMRGYLKKHGG